MNNYGNTPLIPMWVGPTGGRMYRTPDRRYLINYMPDVEPYRCWMVSESQDGCVPYRDRFAGTQLEVEVQLGVILYPPGSEPSPEPHGHGPAYERHVERMARQDEEGTSMEPLPEMEPEPGSDQPTTEIVK